MKDQAAKLRNLQFERDQGLMMQESPGHPATSMVVIASGKGGVGKTVLTANLGLLLSRRGRRILIVDGDIGLSDLDVMMDLYRTGFTGGPPVTREEVENCLIRVNDTLDILPGGTGEGFPQGWDEGWRRRFIRVLLALKRQYDLVLVDTGSGISPDVLDFLGAGDTILLVTTPEPSSFTDTYAVLKMVQSGYPKKKIELLVNMVESYEDYRDTVVRFNLVTDYFLGSGVASLGYVLSDRLVREAVKNQKAFVEAYPGAPASECLAKVTDLLLKEMNNERRGSLETLSEA